MGEKNKNNLKEATKRFCEDIEASLSKGELKGFKKFEVSKKCDIATGVVMLEIHITLKTNDIETLKRLGYLEEWQVWKMM